MVDAKGEFAMLVDEKGDAATLFVARGDCATLVDANGECAMPVADAPMLDTEGDAGAVAMATAR